MRNTVGLLTDDRELLAYFNENYPALDVINYRSVDSVKKEDYSTLLIDCTIFDSADSIQFFLSKIRKKIQEIPVLLLMAENLVADLKMDWFYDDFIILPFRRYELSTRIKRLLWEKGEDDDIITIGRLKLNLKEYSVYLDNQRLELTYKEFELLRLLVENKGVVYSRKELLNKIWGMEYIGGTRTVDVHVRRLRGKLGDEFNSAIETVRNVGYKCKD